MNCITNDELSDIDAKLAWKLDLPFELAEKLRAKLAANDAESVRRKKALADAWREIDALRDQLDRKDELVVGYLKEISTQLAAEDGHAAAWVERVANDIAQGEHRKVML